MSEIEKKSREFGEQEGLRGDGTPKWYVIHTYSGHEDKVKVNIEKLAKNRDMEDLIVSVIVPKENRLELKKGKMEVKSRKVYPGYVIVKMIITNESWYLVRNTQGVTGFVGHGSNPVPLSLDEIRRMGIEKIDVDLNLKVGDSIRVINAPFEGSVGVVEEVVEEKHRAKVKVSVNGREIPIDLEFAQIDKI